MIRTREVMEPLDQGSDEPPLPPVIPLRGKIVKTAGQGEFDNLHIAPKMVVRPQYVTSKRIPKEKLLGLDRITMAPFCFHDCLHMHVRWGAGDNDAQNRGWRDEETPNALAGAPLVPTNQKVTLNLLSPTSFEYIAEAQGVRAGTWQIMLHDGPADALNRQVSAERGPWRGESGQRRLGFPGRMGTHVLESAVVPPPTEFSINA